MTIGKYFLAGSNEFTLLSCRVIPASSLYFRDLRLLSTEKNTAQYQGKCSTC